MIEPNSSGILETDFVIIGAGIAGVTAFAFLSTRAKCILCERKPPHQKYSLSRVMCNHSFQFLPFLDASNNQVFPRTHLYTIYASQQYEAKISADEFGSPLGKFLDEYEFLLAMEQIGCNNGGIIKFNTEINQIEITQERVICQDTTGNLIHAKAILLGTGSDFTLSNKLGFAQPDTVNWVAATFHGTPEQIEKNVPQYIFRMHPKMSKDGPLALNIGRDFFNIGLISKEPFEVIEERFLRILKNYQPIRNYFTGLTPNPDSIHREQLQKGVGVKHPIKNFVKDRVVLIGDAAGLVTPMYYEGVLGAFASTRFASETLIEIHKTTGIFSAANLKQYERKVYEILLKRYFVSGTRSEALFLTSGSDAEVIWDTYIQVLKKYPQARRNVHYVFGCDDLANYPLEHDEEVGELIFKELPLSRKVMLTPLFLRMKLEKNP
jgi:flavin-dependent dehydrogenase